MKKIVYLITDNGIDGREPTNIVSAFWDETERDEALKRDKSKEYRTVREQIVDPDKATKEALAKLNGLDMLLLSEYFGEQYQ